VNPLYRLAQARERLILGHALPLLSEQDEVVCWVRARRMPDGKHGFVYVTREALIFCWTQGKDEQLAVAWRELRGLGVKTGQRGGPVLEISNEGKTTAAQMPVGTRGMARAVNAFLAEVSARAPHARGLNGDGRDGSHEPKVPVVDRERRTLVAHGRRFFVTVAGMFLILIGVAFASPFVPGPGILTILFGLGLLATEYDWAKDAHHWGRRKAMKFADRLRQRRRRRRLRRRTE
jgi:uncharacterized protein (TIGR02611 family)